MSRRIIVVLAAVGLVLAVVTLALVNGSPNQPDRLAQAVEPATETPSATPAPSDTPTETPTPTPTRTPTPTPNPYLAYTVEGLRERDYPGGEIRNTGYWEETDAFTRYYIAYPSDGLIISGMMAVPKGAGSFPVIILNHGYIPPSEYWTGADTYDASTYLASRGFLTISPDFRGWGRSDTGENVFRTGLAIDVMNLISALPSLAQADPARVGIWGHNMGGGAVSWVMAVDPRVKASLLYAPVSADARERRRFGGGPGNPSANDALWSDDPAFLDKISPINYFDAVAGAVQIHQGTADTTTPPRWAEAIHRALLGAAGRRQAGGVLQLRGAGPRAARRRLARLHAAHGRLLCGTPVSGSVHRFISAE